PTPLHLLFSFTAPPPPATHTLSLHDALPIFRRSAPQCDRETRHRGIEHRLQQDGGEDEPHDRDEGEHAPEVHEAVGVASQSTQRDRKSTRLNSSHVAISYAVFCLKKKKK